MRTAMFKTDFWEEDGIFELNTDTKAIYICLLTNPKRDLTPAFKLGDRMLSTYSGYSYDAIKLSRNQLIERGFIDYVDGYYILCKQNYVQPSTGRDSAKIFERNIKNLPLSVLENIKSKGLLVPLESTGTPTGTSTSVIDITIDIHKDIIIKTEHVFDELKRTFNQPLAKLATYQKAIQDLLVEKVFTEEEILKAARCLAASPYHKGENDQKTVYATISFLFGHTKAENKRRIAKWSDMPEPKQKKNYGF